jgi:hypothetical protein
MVASRYLHFEMSARDAHPQPGSPDGLTAGLGELKRRLEEIMSRPKATVRDAEEAAEAAKALAELMRGEERALRLLRTEAEPPAGGDTHRVAEPSRRYWVTGLPLHTAAERVLDDLGWPMHVRELGVRIKSRGWQHPRSKSARPDQIEYQLAAQLPRHPEVFKRFAPNTFGLAKWGDSPPRTEAPKPRLGIISSGEPYTGPSARWLSEHDEAWYDDMVKDDRG